MHPEELKVWHPPLVDPWERPSPRNQLEVRYLVCTSLAKRAQLASWVDTVYEMACDLKDANGMTAKEALDRAMQDEAVPTEYNTKRRVLHELSWYFTKAQVGILLAAVEAH
jgi:hypothetical protein